MDNLARVPENKPQSLRTPGRASRWAKRREDLPRLQRGALHEGLYVIDLGEPRRDPWGDGWTVEYLYVTEREALAKGWL